jgi:hypothetical protein
VRPGHIVDLVQALPKVSYSGIVDKDVEPPKLLHRLTHCLLNMEFICDRSGNGKGFAMLFRNVVHNPVQLSLSPPRDHDRSPFARKGFRDRFTDTGVTSRDDRNLST